MGFRLIILAVLGLGGLYMIHLLAQDFNKIRKPFGGGGPAAAAAAVKGIRSLFFSKRDLTSKSYKKYIEEVITVINIISIVIRSSSIIIYLNACVRVI